MTIPRVRVSKLGGFIVRREISLISGGIRLGSSGPIPSMRHRENSEPSQC